MVLITSREVARVLRQSRGPVIDSVCCRRASRFSTMQRLHTATPSGWWVPGAMRGLIGIKRCRVCDANNAYHVRDLNACWERSQVVMCGPRCDAAALYQRWVSVWVSIFQSFTFYFW